MTMAIVISLVGLILVIAVHIAVIARWSGRIDGYMQANDKRFEAFVEATNLRMDEHKAEIMRLRDARHVADGNIQRHEGMLRDIERRGLGRRSTDYLISEGEG